MSKMPAKKKSCFQITSVTQAQVAAIGATDDTESLDDPDESRTEDVSSEIYDMSRAEYEPACDRSSSEEALNNVGDIDTVGVVAPSHVPEVGQLPALSTIPMEFPKAAVAASAQGGQPPQGLGVASVLPPITQLGVMQQQHPAPAAGAGPAGVSVNASQPAAVTSSGPPPATSTVSCTSRFRVIKLDHGTGEPFRRGRWMCTEFYDKDPESSAISRSGDGVRHSSTTLDPADRDSGLILTGGSVVALSQGLGSLADTALSSSRMHSVETPPQQQLHHQNYIACPQGVSGSTVQSAFSISKPTPVSAQPTVGSLQASASQNVLPVGQNGLPHSGVHIQKSPIMPPSSQSIVYPPQQQQQQQQQQQLPLGHHLTSQLPVLIQNQTEYYQQPASLQPGLSTGPSLPVSSLSAGLQSVGQGPASIIPPVSGVPSVPIQVIDVAVTGVTGVTVPTGTSASSLLQQQAVGMGGVVGAILVGGSPLQQQTVTQYANVGQPQPHILSSTSSGVQNVPAIAVSSSVPTTVLPAVPSASSAAMPNVTTSSLPLGHIPHNKTPAALGTQGLPASGFGQAEGGGGRKSEGLVNMQSPVVSGKDLVKPFIPESLQLTTPTVNSLLGIHIPVDGEEDRNPSKAFYQAFQSGGRLRDSKANSDSASGTNVVAIDNKIEQAMDLVKSHLMYAVREEVEVLKEQIKELFERNSVLERENAVLKSLANTEQLSQLSTQSSASAGATPPQQVLSQPQQQAQAPLQVQPHPQPQPQLQPQPQPQPQPQSQTLPQPLPQPQNLPKPQQLQTQPQLDPGQHQLQPNVTSA